MPLMDDTPVDGLISELESVDPAAAPDLADAVAEALSTELDDEQEDDAPAPTP